MSDGCCCSNRRDLRLAPVAIDQAVAEAVETERLACQEYLRGKIAEVQSLAARGTIAKDDADLLAVRLDAAADGIGAGLHLAADARPTVRVTGG